MTAPTVLIIEDNPLNVELASDLLEARGFAIRATNTAEEGLRMAREWTGCARRGRCGPTPRRRI